MSPASGDSNYSSSRLALLNDRVSIQLMSPASGDLGLMVAVDKFDPGFHSINVPSEWGPIEGPVRDTITWAFPFN